MNFSTNYDDLGSSLLPEGKYECIVKDAFPSETKKGTPYLDIRLVIRNDVEQKYQNKYIFHSIWKKKEPSEQDKQVDCYSFKQLMSLANAAGLPSGKSYASVEELCKDFVGKCVNAETEHDEYDGKTNVRVKYCNKTEYPECKHVFKEAPAAADSNTYQKPKQDAFAQPATVRTPSDINLDDFEEIIGDGDLPF
ncbi:MAG: DUF669 domain-containing protein [Oscillospiraceae bacterium]